MHSKRGLIVGIAWVAMFSMMTTGCVKSRSDIVSPGVNPGDGQGGYAQGANPSNGQESWALKAFGDGASDRIIKRSPYTITTGPVIKKTKNSEAVELKIESDVEDMRQFDVVSFDTEDPHLRGKEGVADMLGQPNKSYGIAYELTPNYLVIYKVVGLDELSDFEKSYATEDGGEYLVPVGGYAIESFYNLIKAVNDDNRPTNLIIKDPVPRNEFRRAQYYTINFDAFIKFERQEKFDVLKKSFFEGEWYFSETTVEARLDKGTVVGDLGSSDSNFLSATRIIFMNQGDNLVGLNTNVDEEFKTEDDAYLNYNTVIKFPIENLDYRRYTSGLDILKEVVDEIKDKEEREYIKIDFLKSETPQSIAGTQADPNDPNSLLDGIYNRINNFKTLLDVTYGKNYFSFSVKDTQTGSIKRYSFKKLVDKPINPRRAFREDNYLFGTFTTLKSKKMDFKVNLKEDEDKLILMARHNPEKDIVYYFTDQTAKGNDPIYGWHRDIGRAAIDLWNQAFKAAGLKIQIRLDESKDVPLGDIRYNVLNIVRRAGAGLLGFGPSLIDSETGEIVSASMNMGMDNMMEQYYRVVRDYIGRKSGRYFDFRKDQEDTELPPVLALITAVNEHKFAVDPETGVMRLNSNAGLSADKTQLDPAQFSVNERAIMQHFGLSTAGSVEKFVKDMGNLRRNSFKHMNMPSIFNMVTRATAEGEFSATQFTDGNIEANCPEVVALAKTLETSTIDTDEEIKIITPCVILFAKTDALTTVLHELGHNLSMRHNFIASVDQKNFPKTGTFKIDLNKAPSMVIPDNMLAPKSSSVMDYLTMEGQQIDLGGYDIATIRWIYNDEVEDINGEFKPIYTINPKTGLREYKKSIQEVIPKDKMKPYMYCTDEQRIFQTDALCNYFDQGVSSKESVKYSIDAIYNVLAKLYRYDSYGISFARVYGGYKREMDNIINHYYKWRFFLLRETGTSRRYMQKMDINAYNAMITKLLNSSDPAIKAQAAEFLEVRNMTVRMLLDLTFLSNKYCLVTDKDNQEQLIELEKIRRELFGSGVFAVVSTCESPAAAEYLKNKDLTFVKEFGHFLDVGAFDLDPNKVLEDLDFLGTSEFRKDAFYTLTIRNSPLWNLVKGDRFLPTMMDEPDVRQYVQALLQDRLVNGVRVGGPDATKANFSMGTRTFNATDVQEITKLPVYKNFANESELHSFLAMRTRVAMGMMGEPDDGRYMTMFVGQNPTEDLIKNAPNYIDVGSTYLYVRDNNSVTGKMMAKAQELQAKLGMTSNLDASQINAYKTTILAELTAKNVLPQTTSVTMKDIVVIVNYLAQAFNDSKVPVGQKILLQEIFQSELSTYNQLVTLAQQQFGATPQQLLAALNDPNLDAATKAAITQLLSQPVNYGLLASPPLLANVETRINSFSVKYTSEYNFYSKYNEELQAQTTSLINILGELAGL